MESKYSVKYLFPLPLYLNHLPKTLIEDYKEHFDNELIIKNEEFLAKEYGDRSKNSYVLNQDLYKNLKNYILEHVVNYAENYLGYNYQNYKFTQSWVSIKHPNQSHTIHSHHNSLISGVLFYEDNNGDDSSKIYFFRNDDYSRTIQGHKTKPLQNLPESCYTTYEIFPTKGLLLLFPSYLEHAVKKNTTNTPRKSFAFNVIPRDGFGTEEGLTELKFND